jgi:hypothetical protein
MTGRAEVAEPEHRGAVGHDRDRVPLDRQTTGVLRMGRDGQADARDAGRVGHRQVVAVAQRHLRLDRELPAEVHEERAVADAVDDDTGEDAERVDDLRGVLLAPRRAGHVDGHVLVPRRRDVERGDDPALALDRGRELAHGSGACEHLEARGDG